MKHEKCDRKTRCLNYKFDSCQGCNIQIQDVTNEGELK